MKNRIFALLLAVAMIVAVSACNGGAQNAATTAAPAATTTAATTAAPATEAAATEAAAAETEAAATEAATAAATEAATTAAAETTAAEAPPAESAGGYSGDLAPYEIVYALLSNELYSDIGDVEDAINALTVPLINATVKFRQGTWSDWQERAILPVQSGEKVDLLFTADWYYYMRSISQNIIIPLNDPSSPYGDLLNTYAPDAVRLLGDAFIQGVEVDGVAYGVPTNKELTVPNGMQYNETLVDKYGIDINSIKVEADLEEALAIVKEGEGPNFYPVLTNGNWMSPFIDVASGFDDAVMYNDRLADGSDDMNIYWIWDRPEMVEHLDRYREWNLKGYINPDAHLTTYHDTEDRNAGRFFVDPGKALTFEGNDANEMMAASGNPDLRLVDKVCQEARQLTTHAGGSMMSIPITSQDPARAMMLLNLMHSNPDVINTMVFGVEGKNYTKVGANVAHVIDEDAWYGVHAGPWIFGNQYIQWTADFEEPDKYDKLKAFSQSGIPHPSLGFRFEPTPVENEIAANESIKDAMSRSLRTGAVDPRVELPIMVQDLRNAGSDKIMQEVLDQFAAWYAKMH